MNEACKDAESVWTMYILPIKLIISRLRIKPATTKHCCTDPFPINYWTLWAKRLIFQTFEMSAVKIFQVSSQKVLWKKKKKQKKRGKIGHTCGWNLDFPRSSSLGVLLAAKDARSGDVFQESNPKLERGAEEGGKLTLLEALLRGLTLFMPHMTQLFFF